MQLKASVEISAKELILMHWITLQRLTTDYRAV